MLHDGEAQSTSQQIDHRISQDIVLSCVDADGRTMALTTTFGYAPSDPFAVTTTFRTQWCEVVWTFARELLSQGQTEPTGDGDVHIWPCLDADGRAIVIIELTSPDGELLVQAPAREVSGFLGRTTALVPIGTESAHIDVDDLIHHLLAA
ncbi:MAG TPA: SsgA family sporulation/cell division regulator [Nocardioides sp.]